MNTSELTTNDRKLIETALNLPCIEWDKVDNLIKRADTNECRERLRNIRSELYHREEAMCGCI